MLHTGLCRSSVDTARILSWIVVRCILKGYKGRVKASVVLPTSVLIFLGLPALCHPLRISEVHEIPKLREVVYCLDSLKQYCVSGRASLAGGRAFHSTFDCDTVCDSEVNHNGPFGSEEHVDTLHALPVRKSRGPLRVRVSAIRSSNGRADFNFDLGSIALRGMLRLLSSFLSTRISS